MGNSLCCPTTNPCDHTVDETQGLLNSPDSKVSARPLTTDGISQALAVKEGKNEDRQEKAVISTQPVAASKLAEGSAQSSYGSVIQMLHTDVSLAAQTSQSASPISKASHEPEDATTTATETKENDETTEEIQTSATKDTDTLPGSTPTELAAAIVKEEKQVELSDALEQEDESGVHELMVPDTLAKTADELHVVQVDAPKEVPEDTEMLSAEVDKYFAEVSGEMNNKREAGEVETEEDELKAPVGVLPTIDIPQTEEPVLSDLPVDGLESKSLLTSVEVADNSAHLLPDNSNLEHFASLSQPSSDVEKTALAIEKIVAGNGLDIHEEIVGVKEDFLPSKTQETPETVNIIEESTVNYVEKGIVNDLTDGDLKDEKPAEVNVEEPLLTEVVQKPCEEPSHTENQELLHEPPTNNKSVAEDLEKREPTDTTETHETITVSLQKEGEVQQAFQNGLLTHEEKPHSTEEPDEYVNENDPESKDTGPSEIFPLEHILTEEGEPAPQACENDENDELTAEHEKENAERTQGQKGEEIVLSSSPYIKVALIPVSDIENIAEKDGHEQNEDLYRGDEETDQEQDKEVKLVPLLEFTIPGVENKCSLDDPVDILEYSEREWKGNTAKSNLIRKGYSEMYCSFTGLRRVRGDNYCSLRATLYQVLASTTRTPAWLLEEDFTSLPEKIEAQEQLIGMWMFPPQCVKAGEDEDAVEKLKHYLELLQKRWQAAAESESLEDKQAVCDHVFQGGEEEYALLEVLKFLMLVQAVEFHNRMLAEEEVPVFCWLLFARDTSESPKMFFNNHLRQVGFTGGLEQVEMFLLGYALQHTIQAFRLYKTDTEEFVTHYPDDHKHDWPCVCIVTEDDRHYNVPIRKPTQYKV